MKNPLASKTLWFNIIMGALMVIEAQLHVITPLLPGGWAPWVIIGVPIANVILRALTTEPLKLTR